MGKRGVYARRVVEKYIEQVKAGQIDDRTTQYALDVVSGAIVAGKYVRAQAQRHISDLSRRDIKFDLSAANFAIRFFPSVLTITAGEKAGAPFDLMPWQIFVVGSIYGWISEDGYNRFKFIWLEMGKGQGKSPLMAGIAIYQLLSPKVKRPEIYCIGQNKQTAKIPFKDIASMCRSEIPHKNKSLAELKKVILRG